MAAGPVSRLRLALTSGWNLLGVAAAVGAAAATKQVWPLFVGAGLEAAWLAFATRPRAARILFPGELEAAEAAAAERRRAEQLAALPPEAAERARRLEDRRAGIVRLASENRRLAGGLLAEEIAKLDELATTFVDFSALAARLDRQLREVGDDELERELAKAERDAGAAVDEDRRRLARQKLDVLLEQREQREEMQRTLARARAQLDLIERTFQLLGNQVLLMSSPRELGEKLDDLRVGVEAVREMTSPAGPAPRAQASAARLHAEGAPNPKRNVP